MSVQEKEKGFTIIEVVLVLAIAGLIFLMVFLALPALQRNQRDTQRKNDVSRAITAVTSYASNSHGNLPTFNAAFTTGYLTVNSSTFVDPAGSPKKGDPGYSSAGTYAFVDDKGAALTGAWDADKNQNAIYYSVGYTCDTSAGTFKSAGGRTVALAIYLEGGGYFCANN